MLGLIISIVVILIITLLIFLFVYSINKSKRKDRYGKEGFLNVIDRKYGWYC